MTLCIFKSNEHAARFAGVFDGDGSAIAQLKRNNDYVMGFQIQCTLQVTQKTTRRAFLDEIQGEIGVGYVRDRSKEPVSDYVLTRRNVIVDVLKDIYPYLRKDIKQRQATILLEILALMSDPTFTKNHVKFLAICDLTDELAKLNDSRNRSNTAAVVRQHLRSKGYDV